LIGIGSALRNAPACISSAYRQGEPRDEGTVCYRRDHLVGLDYQSVEDLKALDALPAPAT